MNLKPRKSLIGILAGVSLALATLVFPKGCINVLAPLEKDFDYVYRGYIHHELANIRFGAEDICRGYSDGGNFNLGGLTIPPKKEVMDWYNSREKKLLSFSGCLQDYDSIKCEKKYLGRRNRRPAYGFTTEKRSDFDGGSLGWSRYNFCREFDFSKELLSEINLTGEQRKEYVEVKDGVGRWSFENWKKNKNSTLLN